MIDSTKSILISVFRADPTIATEQIEAVMDILEGRASKRAEIKMSEGEDRVVSFRDAAEMMGVSVPRVRDLARAGIIRRVRLKGQSRATGCSFASIQAAIRDGGDYKMDYTECNFARKEAV